MRMIVTALPFATLLLTAGTWASAATLDVPSTYPTIQAGIDAAADGDVVLVAPGTYSGPGNRDISLRGKEIRLEGEAGPEVTIVDCGGSAEEPHLGFICESGEVRGTTISGFQIINAYNHDGRGGAILVRHPYAATFEDCIVRQCSASSVVDVWHTELRRILVEGCSDGTMVRLANGEMYDVRILGNDGTGLELDYDCLVTDCTIRGNSFGGLVSDGSGEVSRVAIEGNGGVAVTLFGGPTFTECTIAGNSDEAIFALDTSARFERCVIYNNVIVGESYGIGQVTLSCCLLEDLSFVDEDGWIIEDPLLLDDPLFCGGVDWREAPTMDGDYSVREGSPCLPENNPCGLQIGAYGQGCDVSSVPSADAVVPSGITFISQMPARGEIRFRLNSALTGGPVRAILLDPAGRRVASREFSGFEAGGELEWRPESDLPSGTYLLRVVSESGESASGKFVWLD